MTHITPSVAPVTSDSADIDPTSRYTIVKCGYNYNFNNIVDW